MRCYYDIITSKHARLNDDYIAIRNTGYPSSTLLRITENYESILVKDR